MMPPVNWVAVVIAAIALLLSLSRLLWRRHLCFRRIPSAVSLGITVVSSGSIIAAGYLIGEVSTFKSRSESSIRIVLFNGVPGCLGARSLGFLHVKASPHLHPCHLGSHTLSFSLRAIEFFSTSGVTSLVPPHFVAYPSPTRPDLFHHAAHRAVTFLCPSLQLARGQHCNGPPPVRAPLHGVCA